MPTVQSSVSDKPAIGRAGQIADSGRDKVARSYVNAEASAEMPFGVMLARGTGDQDALLPHTSAAAMADAFIGVLVFNHAYAKDGELGDTGLKPNVQLSVLTHGRVLVTTEDAVSPGDPVRVRVVTAGMEVAGAFRTAQDLTDCVDISTMARWVTSAGAGELAVLELNMTFAQSGVADT